MSVRGGGQLVVDGLVLALDSSSDRSYPGSGTTWFDLSGQGNNGTLARESIGTVSSSLNVMAFNEASSDNVAFSFVPGYEYYTICAWFNTFEDNIFGIVSWGTNTLYQRRAMIVWNGGAGSVYTLRSSTYSSNPSGTTDLVANTWYHGAVTFNSGSCKIYLNGQLETTDTNLAVTPTTSSLKVGSTNHTNEYMGGYIAQALIYDRVLTDAEILQNYNATKGRFF